ncbi:MAG: hypothetical protein KJ732_01410 [Candidatus Margulisbacteria bacterium]|nr:hypothetical protein [Candidatus Margulisiibacteriota bacterium]
MGSPICATGAAKRFQFPIMALQRPIKLKTENACYQLQMLKITGLQAKQLMSAPMQIRRALDKFSIGIERISGARIRLFPNRHESLRKMTDFFQDFRIDLAPGEVTLLEIAEAIDIKPLDLLTFVEEGNLDDLIARTVVLSPRKNSDLITGIFQQSDIQEISRRISLTTPQQLQELSLRGMQLLAQRTQIPTILEQEIAGYTGAAPMSAALEHLNLGLFIEAMQRVASIQAETVTTLESLQQSFQEALGFPKEFRPMKFIAWPAYLGTHRIREVANLVGTTEVETSEGIMAKAKLHKLLIAYAQQEGDSASLALVHYLLDKADQGKITNPDGLLAEFQALSCLLPLPGSQGEDFVPAPPATTWRKEYIGSIAAHGVQLKQAWLSGNPEAKGFETFLAVWPRDYVRGGKPLSSLMMEYHPGVFVRMLEEVAQAKTDSDISQLKFDHFRIKKSDGFGSIGPFEFVLDKILSYLFFVVDLPCSASTELDFVELHARLTTLAQSFEQKSASSHTAYPQ